MKITIGIEARTKKNSMRLVKLGGRIVPIPSKQYKDFEEKIGVNETLFTEVFK